MTRVVQQISPQKTAMNSIPSIQTQWDTRPGKDSFSLRWHHHFIDANFFQRQFLVFASREENRLAEVEELSLMYCPFQGIGVALRILLSKLPNLKSLNFVACDMRAKDIGQALEGIKDNTLEGLFLVEPVTHPELWERVISFVGKQKRIRSLHLSFPSTSLESTTRLLRGLLNNESLYQLFLTVDRNEECVVDASFVEALCTVVRRCKILSVATFYCGEYRMKAELLQKLVIAVWEHEYLRIFRFNGEHEAFWSVLRLTADTQYRNHLRSVYDRGQGFRSSKLVFLGDGGVGKSSTVRTLLGETFREYHDSTVVLDLSKFAKLDVFDYTFNKIHSDDFLPYQSKLLLTKSLIYSEKPSSKLKLQPSRFKFDFEEDIVDQILHDDCTHDYLRTGVVPEDTTDQLFQIFDFGGQEVFYSLHHLLLTNSGIHVLVFNMVKTEESDMQNVRFWMESLLLNAPDSLVIIIGTHLESLRKLSVAGGVELSELLQTVNDELLDTYEASSGRLQIIRNRRLSFFPLDNSNGPESEESKSIIDAIVKANSGAAGFNRSVFFLEVPIGEQLFMSKLLEKVTHMRQDEFSLLAKQAGFEPAETEHMLDEYTKSGLILYFPDVAPEGNTSANIITFSPNWLTSALSKVVFDKMLHKHACQPPLKLRKDYQRYLKTAVLSKELLDFFWLEYFAKKEFLLECSLKMLVMVRFRYNEKEEYLVPSMLPKEPIDTLRVPFNIPTEFHTAIYFTKYMPLGFFPRIIAVFVDLAQCSESSSTPMLSRSFCRIVLDANFVVCLVVNQANNLVSICLETEQTSLPRLVKLTEDVIKKIKNSVYQTKIDAVGLALAAKFPGERRQPVVKIGNLESRGNRRVYQDYLTQGVVDTTRFLSFKIPRVNRPKQNFHLFLSHTWGRENETHYQVIKIEKLLTGEGLKCWIDERYMRGHIDLDMLHGLECSSACVIFLTDLLTERLLNENNNITKEFYQILRDRNNGKPVFLAALESHLTDRKNWPDRNPLTLNYRLGRIFDFSSEEAIRENIVKLKSLV